MSDLTSKSITPLSNCTLDTNYRFTFYQVSYSVIFLLGLATNALVLHRLCLSRCKMNSTSVYVISLSITDLLFVFSLPLRIYYYHTKMRDLSTNTGNSSSWTPGVAYCQLTFTVKYLSMYGGIFFLVCIAVDRYLAVVHPLASTLRRLRAAQVVSGVIWVQVLGLSVSLPLLRSLATNQNQPCLLDPSSRHHHTIILVFLGLVLGSFLLPTLLLFYSYCKVLSALSRSRRRCRSNHRHHQHTLRVIYLVLGVFLLCFLPYHVNLLGYTLTQVKLMPYCGLARVTKAVHPIMITLASFNCCLNPLIYYFSQSHTNRQLSGGGAAAFSDGTFMKINNCFIQQFANSIWHCLSPTKGPLNY
ncbi:lysophosphatidic acid receptor 6 [Pholidichthys leucotaenia]